MDIKNFYDYYKSKEGYLSYDVYEIYFVIFWNIIEDPFNEFSHTPFILKNGKSKWITQESILNKVKQFINERK